MSVRRRSLLGAGLAGAVGTAAGAMAIGALAGCRAGERPPPPTLATLPPGGWWGDDLARGHRLRAAAGGAPARPAGAPVRRCDVAIIGAGIAGLAAARALRQAGIEDLRVFELAAQPGGNARSDRLGGIACPVGAHYLPVPQPPAHEVIDWLHEIGLLRQHLGRTLPDERHLCHSPQERLWLHGPWQEGLLPPAVPGSARLDQYRRFAQAVDEARRTLGFALPSRRAPWTAGHAALDGQTFAAWLEARGLTDPGLRWALDYACRDDYGADARTVSAWAGLHYFASRHGFHVPGEHEAERDAVFTWPEGNAWLVQRLAAPLGDRLVTGRGALRIEAGRHEVGLDLLAAEPGEAAAPVVERWVARQVVLAVPLHLAARTVVSPPAALQAAAAQVQHAPWLVANLQLAEPLTDKPGAAPAWDNVLLPPGVPAEAPAAGAGEGTGTAAIAPAHGAPPAAPAPVGVPLGYVDAMHQSLRPVPGPTVLTAYWALGDGSAADRAARRAALAGADWRPWALQVLADLARAHPDLPGKTVALRLARHGHAMAIPLPGSRGLPALAALAEGEATARLHLAHADLAGYSVFEEAFTLGHQAGTRVARALRRPGGP